MTGVQTCALPIYEISLEGDVPEKITLHLADSLVNLDTELTVKTNGKQVFQGIVPRTQEAIAAALKSRPDPALCPVAVLTLGGS